MPVEFSSLSRSELEALPKQTTVFFFAVGPLEDHGNHLPMSLDLSEARWLCREAALRLEAEKSGWVGVLMPAAPLGIDSDTTGFALTVRAHVLRDWLVDACKALKRAGFFRFVCFSGHLGPRQLTAIEEAGKILNRWRLLDALAGKIARAEFASASSALAPLQVVRGSPLWPDPEEHGGARDTSVALALRAGEAAGDDAGRAAANRAVAFAELPAVKRPGGRLERLRLRVLRQRAGYWGEPAKADLGRGERELRDSLNEVFPKLRAMWEGTSPNLLFRTYYSILPPNRSFFRAWVLFGCVLAVMLLWMISVFRSTVY
jgi:creatinine amidohydrolase/Fe(II)-dependent formamide hydrolase-like protein